MNTSTYQHINQSLYVLLLAFRVTQPIRKQYNLSFNLLLCLIGMYLYTNLYNKDFSRTAIQNFIHYYNNKSIYRFFDIYLNRGLIVISYNRGKFVYYKLTDSAISIINEIPEEYNRVLYQFCNKYNVVL